MSPEDFSYSNKSAHPEVIGATLEIQRPEQVTLRHLLGDITNITSTDNAYEFDTDRAVDMHYPDSQLRVAGIRRFKDRASLDNPNRLAGISRTEQISNEGDRIVTNYFILDSPDGLHIEKHSHKSNPSKEAPGLNATPDEITDLAIASIARITEREKSKAEEDALGLSFVSEQEARDLLKLLYETVPFEKDSY